MSVSRSRPDTRACAVRCEVCCVVSFPPSRPCRYQAGCLGRLDSGSQYVAAYRYVSSRVASLGPRSARRVPWIPSHQSAISPSRKYIRRIIPIELNTRIGYQSKTAQSPRRPDGDADAPRLLGRVRGETKRKRLRQSQLDGVEQSIYDTYRSAIGSDHRTRSPRTASRSRIGSRSDRLVA